MRKILMVVLIMALALSSVGCSHVVADIFRGRMAVEKAQLVRRTTYIYLDYESGSPTYRDTPTSSVIYNYNSKGLIESISNSDGNLQPIQYQYDQNGSPVSITINEGGAVMAFQVTNIYEGSTVKEVQISSQDPEMNFPVKIEGWTVMQCALASSVLLCIEHGINYQDATIRIVGTMVYLERQDGETVHSAMMQPDLLIENEYHQVSDGTSWSMQAYRGSANYINQTFYDTMGRVTRMEFDGASTIVEFAYTEARDPSSGHTVYQASANGVSIRYEFDHDRMLLQDQDLGAAQTRQVTTYTADGQTASYEMYRDGNLYQKEEYEYR